MKNMKFRRLATCVAFVSLFGVGASGQVIDSYCTNCTQYTDTTGCVTNSGAFTFCGSETWRFGSSTYKCKLFKQKAWTCTYPHFYAEHTETWDVVGTECIFGSPGCETIGGGGGPPE